MLTQTVVWTAVPNGVDSGTLQLVCLASPRLGSDGNPAPLTLGHYADAKAWATAAAAATFTVKVGANPAVPATRVSAAPDPTLWAALFTPALPVRPFAFTDHTGDNLRSYPAKHVDDAVAALYRAVAVSSPTAHPHADALLTDLLPGRIALPQGRLDERHHLGVLAGRFTASTKALPPGPPDPLMDFLQLKRFHMVTPGSRPADPKPTPEPLDFHRVLALLMEYPALQRRLGLAFDLSIPLPANMPAATTVQVLATWPAATPGAVNRSPVTKAAYGPGLFGPADAGDIVAGRVALAGPAFAVTGLDIDGAGLQVRQFADTVKRAWTNARSYDTPAAYGLPALRSAGLSVIRTGRAAQQAGRFTTAKAHDTTIAGGGTPVLDAGSLLHGVRWHVYDVASGQWHSLCVRTGEFGAPGLAAVTVTEEAPTTTALTRRASAAGVEPDFHLAEHLCRWHGQSLVARPPGRWFGKDPGDPPTDAVPAPPKEFPLRATFRPLPGSLPPLRFGRRYRLRALATFVGGAGLPFRPPDTGASFAHATAEVTYARLEPVPPPEVLLRAPVTAGETLHHLVIRTDHDSKPTDTEPTERHVVPPKAAQLTAEQHGMFDGPGGIVAGAYDVIVARGDGVLPADRPYDVLSFPVENGGTARIPWLPDPFARRAAFYGLPGGGSFLAGFTTSWPDREPFRLRLVEGTAKPTLSGGVLEVAVGKGDTCEVELSSAPDAADLQAMQVWRWVEHGAGLPAATLAARRAEAVAGRNWLLTPKRRLTLVCATRRPLVAPAHQQPAAPKAALGDTFVTLSDTLTISRKSTAAVDLQARWTDTVDHLDGDTWTPAKQVPRAADLGEVKVDRSGPDGTLPVQRRHELGDTLHHAVSYTAVAKSRFAEYFAETATVTLAGPVVIDPRGVAPHSERVRSQDGATTYAAGVDYTVDHPAGVLARLPGGAIPAGAPLDVAYLPIVSREGAPATVSVLSSARPAPPHPLHVVPTFGWELQRPSTDPALPGDALSRRHGNGLRVHLARPWWSSGAGEQLAVVLAGGGVLPEHLRPYVTRWGADPVFSGAALAADLPAQNRFPLRASSPGAVTLAEVPGAQVTVAPHDVTPDLSPDAGPYAPGGRPRTWFCDIELTPGPAYFPFVRLALARYQPQALPEARLSPVVLADFAQLAPDRSVTLAHPGPSAVHVNVLGPAYHKTAAGPQSFGRVTASVERREPGVPGDLGWVPGPETDLPGVGTAQSLTRWSGQLTLPAPRGSEAMRLVVREYERLGAERLVFTDVVPIL